MNNKNKKVLAIMQPYFLPYIGYFQLFNLVDEFVVYDNIEYTKKGWINRNRILINGAAQYITIPIKKDSDFLTVNERYLSDSWTQDRIKLINKINGSYRKAPYFSNTMPLIESIVNFEERNLFEFIFNSLEVLKQHLSIDTKLIRASSLNYNAELKSQDKVLNICETTGANTYINPIGGKDLYDSETFLANNVELMFMKGEVNEYSQFSEQFVSSLSILDVLMFNKVEDIKNWLSNYKLI